MAQEFTFTVNGVERTTTQNKPLLRYLRDDLHIHSAKDGCSESACGTGTIHVNGAAVKACVLTTALAAYKLQRPVKCKLTRAESLAFHPKRHAMDGTFTLGCDAEGNFTGLDCEINFDTGAYASLCGPVLERACTHAVGPYKYQNTDIRGFGYYTNNPPAGAYRGFVFAGRCRGMRSAASLHRQRRVLHRERSRLRHHVWLATDGRDWRGRARCRLPAARCHA